MLRRDSAHVRTPAAPAAVDEPTRRTTRAAALAAAVAALAALALGLAAAGGAGPAQAVTPAAMTATLSDDGACAFTATVTWKKMAVDHIFAAFYHDGTFVATMEAPGTGPNAGTIRGVKAVFQTGAFPAAAASHAWHVLVQPYTREGVALPQVTTNVVNANCTIPPQ